MFKRMLMATLAWSGAAYAQGTAAPPAAEAQADRISYDAAFFAQFSPQTAADMVTRVPGFSINSGDERRGFAGAVGNVLIDGVRPAAKSQDIQSILGQIPAAQVLRVELLRGAATAGDASGQTVLVNVVRTPSAGDGVWGVGAEIDDLRNRPSPNAELSWSGRHGSLDYGLSGNYFSFIRDLPGPRTIYNGQGAITQRVYERSPRDYYEYAAAGNIAFPLAGGRLSANAQYAGWYFDAEPDATFFTPDYVVTARDARDYQEGERTAELGLNFDRAFGAWAFQGVGLVTRRTYDFDETFDRMDANGVRTSVIDQNSVRESGETILRGTISRPFGPRHSVELGLEGAFNSLDAELDFSVDGVPEVIQNGNVLVEEERAEAFGTYTFRPDQRWAYEAKLAREVSTLTFTGDTNQSVDLSFWKPSFQVSRSIGEHNQLRVRVFRDVGQLDFDDFVSAVATTDGRVDGGNPDLVPQTEWRAEIAGDLRFGEGAAISAALFHSWISDVADVVPVGEGVEAPGNIGEAEITGIELNAAIPLSPLIPGGRLTLTSEIVESNVIDPLTGQQRSISGLEDTEWELEFRQDLTALKFAWGIEGYENSPSVFYRSTEIDSERECTCFDVYAETTALEGLRIRGEIQNAWYHGYVRERRFYDDPNRNGPLTGVDRRERDFGTRLRLTVSGKF